MRMRTTSQFESVQDANWMKEDGWVHSVQKIMSVLNYQEPEYEDIGHNKLDLYHIAN